MADTQHDSPAGSAPSKKPRFFEVIPSGTKFDFVGNARSFITGSIVLLLLTFAALAYNASALRTARELSPLPGRSATLGLRVAW